MAACLPGYGQVTGCDFSILALRYCHQRAIRQVAQATVTALPFPSGSFDLITSFDVLYERGVDNPATALAEFKRILRPAGTLLLRLPAYDWLRGRHDQAVHTGRRFDVHSLSRLLHESGLRLLHITYANTFLFPPAVLKRLLERVFPPATGSSDLTLGAGLFNPLLTRILSAEAPIAAGRGLPFGLSVIAIAQKEGSDER
jgi:SAM-dependent methyltransferase